MSKRVFNFNFNFHFNFNLNIFLFFKNWWVKKFKKNVSFDSLQDNPTERLETVIDSTERQQEQQKPDRQWQKETTQEEERIRRFNEECKRAAEERYHREQALRRGRTFFSDPYLPPIPKMRGELKSLSESCHFRIDDLDD